MTRLILMLVLAALALPAAAQETPDWRALAARDVAEIDRAVRDVFVGMVDPLHPEVAARWAQAVADARERSGQVRDRAGWAATLRRLVNSLRDPHASIRIAPAQPPQPVRWTGHAVEYIAGEFYLRPVEPAEAAAGDLRLLRCDGEPIAVAAERRLDLFVTDWSVAANRPPAAARLLVDGGNPFVAPIRACEVEQEGQVRRIAFSWREAPAVELSAALRPFARRGMPGEPRFAIEWQPDGAAWISVPSFADSAANAGLRERIAAELERVRRAPYIVFDVRGNGGGNSLISTQLSALLWGAGSVAPPPPPTRRKQWRPSAELAHSLRALRARSGDGAAPNPERDAFIDLVLPAIERGLARGDALVDDPQQAAAEAAGAPPRTVPARTGPVFVLTDGGCQSTCIMFTHEVRRMGGRQVGDPTDRNTIYAEQWYAGMLPSGMAQLLLPTALFGWPESELGGGPPDIPWTGSGADEAGLRTLIAAAAARLNGATPPR